MPNETAIGIVVALEAADDLSAVKAALRGFAASFGYDRFVLFSASASRDEVIEQIYGIEGDWFGDGGVVDSKTYVQRCPVNCYLRGSAAPARGAGRGGRHGSHRPRARNPGLGCRRSSPRQDRDDAGPVRAHGRKSSAPDPRRLGVATTAQAIRIAIRRGEIVA